MHLGNHSLLLSDQMVHLTISHNVLLKQKIRFRPYYGHEIRMQRTPQILSIFSHEAGLDLSPNLRESTQHTVQARSRPSFGKLSSLRPNAQAQ